MMSLIVAEILGQAVVWDVVDWLLPTSKVSVASASPLDAANTLLQAIGALVVSNPDGTLRVRYKYPNNWDTLKSISPSHIVGEGFDILSATSGYEYRKGYNSYWISDSDASYSDKITWVPDEINILTGVAKVEPFPYRSSWELATTSEFPITLSPMGEILEDFTEVVEIIGGKGSTKETILAIGSVVWLSVPLGALSFEPYTSGITAPSTVNYGYGLVKVTYTNKSYRFNISAPYAIEAAQLIVKEI